MSLFKLKSPFEPCGSQPEAIKELLAERPGISTLMGVTGSGKTFTMGTAPGVEGIIQISMQDIFRQLNATDGL